MPPTASNLAKLSILAAVLAGCGMRDGLELQSQAPIATNYPMTQQRTLGAAAHWQLLAQDNANRIVQALSGKGFSPYDGLIIHVPPPSTASPFEAAFRDMTINALTSATLPNGRGVAVSDTPTGTLRLDTTVRLIEHDPNRWVRPPLGATTATLTGAGVLAYAIYGAIDGGSAVLGGLAGLGAIAALDLLAGSRSDTPNTEIVVNSVVRSGNHIVYGSQGIYYVPSGDVTLYHQDEGPRGRAIRVVAE